MCYINGTNYSNSETMLYLGGGRLFSHESSMLELPALERFDFLEEERVSNAIDVMPDLMYSLLRGRARCLGFLEDRLIYVTQGAVRCICICLCHLVKQYQ